MQRVSRSCLLIVALWSGCASNGLGDDACFTLYRAHVGAPVYAFEYLDQLSGGGALGDNALAVCMRPDQAYLLGFAGRCQHLDIAPSIAMTYLGNEVSAWFDEVMVLGGGPATIRLRCQIERIRPLDVKALWASEKALREANLQERTRPTSGG